MRELENQLQRLRQVLFDMPQTPIMQQQEWMDWTERFHAALLYIHQAGIVCERPEVEHRLQRLLLNPNILNNGDFQTIPDILFRTKLDNVEYTTNDNGNDQEQKEQGFKDRAKVLLEQFEERNVAVFPIMSPSAVAAASVDYSLLKLYYSGVKGEA